MQRATLTLVNSSGLHARPAALFVQTAARFKSDITVRNATRDTPAVNAKSILTVLTLGVEQGHAIEVVSAGIDEVDALAALTVLVESGLGEGRG